MEDACCMSKGIQDCYPSEYVHQKEGRKEIWTILALTNFRYIVQLCPQVSWHYSVQCLVQYFERWNLCGGWSVGSEKSSLDGSAAFSTNAVCILVLACAVFCRCEPVSLLLSCSCFARSNSIERQVAGMRQNGHGPCIENRTFQHTQSP